MGVGHTTGLTENFGGVLTAKHICSRWPFGKSAHATEWERAHWDLHIHSPPVSAKDSFARSNILWDIAETTGDGEIARLALQFDTSVAILGVMEHFQHANWNDVADDAELEERDLPRLEDACLVSAAKKAARCTVRIFSVGEKDCRRRWITHTAILNKLTEQLLPDFQLPMPEKLLPRVAEFAYGVCIDFKSYYHQFGLPNRWRRFFVFQLRGRKYHLRTIPTGGNSPPAAAQAYSEIIARLVKLKFVKIATDVYIDNLRLLAHSREALEDALRYVFEVCLILQVEINDELDECLKRNFTEYEFLGIIYCHVSRTTKLSEKTRSKLTKIATLMDDPMVSLRTAMSCTSLLIYSSCATDTNRADFYWIFKFLRRRTEQPLDDPAQVWPSIKSMWRIWATLELTKPPRVWAGPAAPLKTGIMYTDASLSGWGAVIFHGDGRMSIRAGPWSADDLATCPSINCLEAKAVKYAFDTMRLDEGEVFNLFVDNTSVLHRLAFGTSKSFSLNAILGQLHQYRARILSTAWVPSAQNIADKWSRMFEGSVCEDNCVRRGGGVTEPGRGDLSPESYRE